MDFAIISPQWVFTYRQKWFLNSSFKEISSHKIKTIQVSNNTFFGNIFKYWSINIVSDWAEIEATHKETIGMIKLDYVDKHYKIKEKITKICF